MGLPMWRDPEKQDKRKQEAGKAADPTATARSAIRRRDWRRRGQLARDPPARPPPRIHRSPPPSVGFRGTLRDSRRTAARPAVPPVSTLLELMDRRSAHSTLAPVPTGHTVSDHETRNARELQAILEQEQELRNSVEALRNGAAELTREAAALEAREQRLHAREAQIERSRPYLVTDSSNRPVPGAYAFAQEHVPFSRSPEPISDNERLSPAEEQTVRPGLLPTPPLDPRDPATRRVFERAWLDSYRALYPNGRAASPINGLGDRERSPVADGWEIMRSTITPDATLPSAESSFASAAASNSFTSNPSTRSTNLTEPDTAPARLVSPGEDDGVVIDDDTCDEFADSDADDLDPTTGFFEDGKMAVTATVAKEMFFLEELTSRGRERIACHAHDMDRYSQLRHKLQQETDVVEIGLRIVNDAFRSLFARSDTNDTDATSGIIVEALNNHFHLQSDMARAPEHRMSDCVRAYRRNMHKVFERISENTVDLGLHFESFPGVLRVPNFDQSVGLLATSGIRTGTIVRRFNLDNEMPGIQVLSFVLQAITGRHLGEVIEKWQTEFPNESHTSPPPRAHTPAGGRDLRHNTARSDRVRTGRVGPNRPRTRIITMGDEDDRSSPRL